MFTSLNIKNFKSIKQESIALKAITVFTGPNSCGKSTALQSILLPQWKNLAADAQRYINQRILPFLPFDEPESSQCKITLSDMSGNEASAYSEDGKILVKAPDEWKNLCSFLCADRAGPRDKYENSSDSSVVFDITGEKCFSYIESNKNQLLEKEMIHPESEMETFLGQVNYWLSHIVSTKISTSINENNKNIVEATYSHNGEMRLPSLMTGFGTSTLVPILVFCLAAKKGDVILIENPEIHLHPSAQAKLADFFSFVSNAGIQVILETHCEHLIYKLCHTVFKENTQKENLIFYYKKSSIESFETICVNDRGRFIDTNGNIKGFPCGFFDATLQEYLTIYR